MKLHKAPQAILTPPQHSILLNTHQRTTMRCAAILFIAAVLSVVAAAPAVSVPLHDPQLHELKQFPLGLSKRWYGCAGRSLFSLSHGQLCQLRFKGAASDWKRQKDWRREAKPDSPAQL